MSMPFVPPSEGPKLPKGCYVYILQCADGTLYTGWSTDPLKRERAHNRGRGARYTRCRLPVRLVYVEPVPDKSAALKREYALKRLSRAEKLALVASFTEDGIFKRGLCNPE